MMTSAQLAATYGGVIRVMAAGESFGELALLQKGITRTATVAAAAPPGAGEAGGEGVSLIRISRRCYDQAVRSLQVGGGWW
jgi:hypothetical protein